MSQGFERIDFTGKPFAGLFLLVSQDIRGAPIAHEQAHAIVGIEELQAGYLRMLADQGLPLPAGMSVPPRGSALAG